MPVTPRRRVGEEQEPAQATRFTLLGPLRAWRGEDELPLGPRQQRLLLAALLAGAGRPVPLSELIGLLWDGEPPVSAVNAVHRYVGSLRRLLEPGLPARSPGRWIVRQAGSYLLGVDAEGLDLLRFRALVRQARASAATGHLPAAVDMYLEALALWQGPCAEDLGALAAVHPAFTLVEHEYAPVVCEAATTALRCGRSGSVLLSVRQAADRCPLDEALQASVLLVLAADGKQAEAITQYHSIRNRLSDELGIDPGPALRAAHQSVLRGGPAEPWVPASTGSMVPPRPRARTPWSGPAQLPRDLASFTGREQALGQALDTARQVGDGLRVVAFDGIPGVGKTASAVHFAHRVAADFPDGRLYADLGGFASHRVPAHPAEVLHGFLEALGVDRRRVPASVEARSALLRSVLSGRRVLMVLDNALDADQVRPLLPGTPECMVVVTSRRRLTRLATTHGARLISLDVLSAAEATECFLRRLGRARADAGTAVIQEIVAGCGRLPLALAVAAARAASRPEQPLTRLAAELTAARGSLAGFDEADGANFLRGAFSWSHRTLGAEAKRVFSLLPRHVPADVSTAALARLAGVPPGAAAVAAGELVRVRLLDVRGPDRYGAHDLVRAYAAELGRTGEPGRVTAPQVRNGHARPSSRGPAAVRAARRTSGRAAPLDASRAMATRPGPG
ncbi:AfsR/SARP family transcriptional regulator [Streptomyces humi]|uniref:AfsR/SARP family transcriptional regulator n=1 Tax=Streptomyces humi TaxID=1428620 RepID=UPI0009A12BDE|nr:BTAD domain-containing putative transcriptional regulator [Streptomyces humi]